MRIGIDARIIGTNGRGMERYTRNLVENLTRIDDKNEYFLYTDHNFDDGITLGKNFTVRFIKSSFKFLPFSNTYLVKEVRKNKIDLFHFPYNTCWLFHRCKTIVTLHDIIPAMYSNEKMKTVGQRFAYKTYLYSIKKNADVIITDSKSSANEITRYLGISSSKISVIYLGKERIFRPIKNKELLDRVRSKYNITNNFIFYTGGFEPRKNVKGLTRAFKLLQKKNRKPFLVISGDIHNAQYIELKKLITHLNLDKRVIFTGRVSDDELVLLYNAADIFVFPSFAEGFGLPSLEAMSCGTPVVTSNISSLPEVVGDAAIKVNPTNEQGLADTIFRILTDLNLKSELSIKGIKQAESFSWKRTARETSLVYQNIFRNSLENE